MLLVVNSTATRGQTEIKKEKTKGIIETATTIFPHDKSKLNINPPTLESIALIRAAAGDLNRQVRKALEHEVHFEERIIWRYFSQVNRMYYRCVAARGERLVPVVLLAVFSGGYAWSVRRENSEGRKGWFSCAFKVHSAAFATAPAGYFPHFVRL